MPNYDPDTDEYNGQIRWHATATIHKYTKEQTDAAREVLGHEPLHEHFQALGVEPEEVMDVPEGNKLVTIGLGNLTNLLIAGGGNGFSSAKAIVGVGATATTEAVGDTHLGSDGASAWYQAPDSAPSRTTTTVTNDAITCTTTFTSANGNFAWAEWGWAAATSGTVTGSATLTSVATTPTFLNHKTASMGTKASGASWALTTKVTFS